MPRIRLPGSQPMSLMRIFRIPPGEAPEWVRKAWVGLTLPFDPNVPPAISVRGVISGEDHALEESYAVPIKTALLILQNRNPEAARWWEENYRLSADYFLFPISGCFELPTH